MKGVRIKKCVRVTFGSGTKVLRTIGTYLTCTGTRTRALNSIYALVVRRVSPPSSTDRHQLSTRDLVLATAAKMDDVTDVRQSVGAEIQAFVGSLVSAVSMPSHLEAILLSNVSCSLEDEVPMSMVIICWEMMR